LPRSASALASWDHLQTSIKTRYKDAHPINVDRNGATLPDGTRIANTGGDGEKGGTNLYRFVLPQSEGGYGGRVFYDADSGHLILTANARTAANQDLVERIEVPYVRNANDDWRADFSAYSKFDTRIDPSLAKSRSKHFAEANKNLAEAWKKDPSLKERLGLDEDVVALVNGGSGKSPKPYTWNHVNGEGDIQLVDSLIHGLFLHEGGIAEWHN